MSTPASWSRFTLAMAAMSRSSMAAARSASASVRDRVAWARRASRNHGAVVEANEGMVEKREVIQAAPCERLQNRQVGDGRGAVSHHRGDILVAERTGGGLSPGRDPRLDGGGVVAPGAEIDDHRQIMIRSRPDQGVHHLGVEPRVALERVHAGCGELLGVGAHARSLEGRVGDGRPDRHGPVHSGPTI